MPRTTTPAPPRRYVLGAGGGTELLLPDGLSAVPDPVRELNDEAVRLHAAAELAAQQFRAAKAEAGRAVAIDEAADREALAAGQPLLERRAVAEAEEALGMAQRRHEAARQNARDAVTELARGISRDKAAWLIEQEGVGAAIQAACTSGTRRPVGPRSPKRRHHGGQRPPIHNSARAAVRGAQQPSSVSARGSANQEPATRLALISRRYGRRHECPVQSLRRCGASIGAMPIGATRVWCARVGRMSCPRRRAGLVHTPRLRRLALATTPSPPAPTRAATASRRSMCSTPKARCALSP